MEARKKQKTQRKEGKERKFAFLCVFLRKKRSARMCGFVYRLLLRQPPSHKTTTTAAAREIFMTLSGTFDS
jgi:hypothetical protein